jgi:hypothetical protein
VILATTRATPRPSSTIAPASRERGGQRLRQAGPVGAGDLVHQTRDEAEGEHETHVPQRVRRPLQDDQHVDDERRSHADDRGADRGRHRQQPQPSSGQADLEQYDGDEQEPLRSVRRRGQGDGDQRAERGGAAEHRIDAALPRR